MKNKLLLGLVAGVLMLALAEGVIRVLFAEAPSMRFEQDVGMLNDLRLPDLVSVIRKDDERFWRLTPNTRLPTNSYPFRGLIANAQGLRENHDIPLKKPAQELRILFLGDSCTFGYGLDFAQGFVDLTEQRLNRALPDRSVECINAGVPGYTLFQGYHYYLTEGRLFQPDLVVVTFGWNDTLHWDNLSDLDHYQQVVNSRPPAFLGWSRLAHKLFHALRPAAGSPADATPRSRVPPSEFSLLLNQLKTATDEHDADLMVVLWCFQPNIRPDLEQPPETDLQRAMRQFAAETSTPLLDAVELFNRAFMQNPEDGLFLDIGHASAFGNRLMAEALTERILEWRQQQGR